MSQSIELPRRLGDAFAALAYIAISVLLVVLSAVAVLALALGALLSVVSIGVPLLLGAVAACRQDRRARPPDGQPAAGSAHRGPSAATAAQRRSVAAGARDAV